MNLGVYQADQSLSGSWTGKKGCAVRSDSGSDPGRGFHGADFGTLVRLDLLVVFLRHPQANPSCQGRIVAEVVLRCRQRADVEDLRYGSRAVVATRIRYEEDTYVQCHGRSEVEGGGDPRSQGMRLGAAWGRCVVHAFIPSQ